MNKTQITNDYVKAKMAIADKTEQHFADFLKGRGWLDINITEGKFAEYDISAFRDCFYTSFELKVASKAERYGTYFVEAYQSGKPSGIQVSTADYYIYYDETGDVTYSRADDLKQYIKDNNLALIGNSYTSYGGKVAAMGYRVPKDFFNFVTKHDINVG